MDTISAVSGDQLSQRSIRIWRVVQFLLWLVGAAILFCLFFYQQLGIHLFWNILIPVAPLLLVVATGLWRNICPMASTALFPRHMSLSKRKKLSVSQLALLNLIAVIALYLIVPLRHAFLDLSGIATGTVILILATIALISGFFFEWKSAWCSGLCPVHPVEKLYGMNNRLNLPNAHCDKCYKCVTPCPDSTPNIHPLSSKKTSINKITGLLFVGGFPGFVWGWFQVQDYAGVQGIAQWTEIYKLPLIGLFVSLALFILLRQFIRERSVVKLFAFAAVAFYYWFRIPALFGYGLFPGDGMLVDLSATVPAVIFTTISIALIALLFWWLVLSKNTKASWAIRPEYGDDVEPVSAV